MESKELKGLYELYEKASQDLELAYQRFNFADQEYIDVAIYEINLKESHLNAILKDIKSIENKLKQAS